MNSCYVVVRNIPEGIAGMVDSRVEALTENLYLAEKVIVNYYTENFGEDGQNLVCVLSPCLSDIREYWMRSHYKEVDGATYFTVYEEEIKNDSAFV